MNRKIASFFAVFFFSFNIISVYNVSADAASLTVTGGSIGTSGLEELTALSPYAAPIILGLFNQAKMDIKLSQQSQAEGMTKTQYLYDQIVNWKDGAPEAVSQVCQRILTGTSIDAEGIIYVGQIALDAVKQFGNWIVSDAGDNYYDGASVPTEEVFYLGNTNCIMKSDNYANSIDINHYNGVKIASTASIGILQYQLTNNRFYPMLVSSEPFTCQLWTGCVTEGIFRSGSSWGTVTSSFTNGIYYAAPTNYYYVNSVYNPSIPLIEGVYNSFSEVVGYLDTASSSAGSGDIDTFFGKSEDWSDFVPGLELPAGYMGAIDFGILNQILAELEQSKNFEMTVEDYLEAINEAVNDKAIDVPVENVDDGSIAYVPDVVVVPDPAYDPVADPDIPVPEEVTPVIDESKPADFENILGQPLTLDLKNFFPFCIPFDLYNLFQKFNAPAVAPHFRINFTIPIVNQEIDYTIDFSPFNDVAAILRTMELITMVVLLALATRRIFLRG